ncbi:hypothetical protein DL93DRAFT_726429 [Clavulina sp. PMI_390]|nr:hypothetical protein DL93DRAFT_726429 [Clavulina sp. PMI_390]
MSLRTICGTRRDIHADELSQEKCGSNQCASFPLAQLPRQRLSISRPLMIKNRRLASTARKHQLAYFYKAHEFSRAFGRPTNGKVGSPTNIHTSGHHGWNFNSSLPSQKSYSNSGSPIPSSMGTPPWDGSCVSSQDVSRVSDTENPKLSELDQIYNVSLLDWQERSFLLMPYRIYNFL